MTATTTAPTTPTAPIVDTKHQNRQRIAIAKHRGWKEHVRGGACSELKPCNRFAPTGPSLIIPGGDGYFTKSLGIIPDYPNDPVPWATIQTEMGFNELSRFCRALAYGVEKVLADTDGEGGTPWKCDLKHLMQAVTASPATKTETYIKLYQLALH